MRFGSVCSGIEAASMAWLPLNWEPAFYSEIDPFPRAVLDYHHGEVPLHGDFTTIEENQYGSIDLLVGGTPCQSFSIAGLRGGLDDDRGNLALQFFKLAKRERPKWLVWENVPGVLSSNDGRDFGAILGALAELGYGFAYRVLDAQYFGVPQRRRRVFVVGYFGDWRPAAAVLFEREGLRRDTPPRREKGQGPADRIVGSLAESSGHARLGDNIQSVDYLQPFETANCLTRRMHKGIKTTVDEGQTPVIAFDSNAGNRIADELQFDKSPPVKIGSSGSGKPPAVAFAENSRAELREMDVAGALSQGGGNPGQGAQTVRSGMQVRRLTPVECERLQGFPDNYTRIPWRGKAPEDCPDGPRYKALGNSMAVPVMRWIGEHIHRFNQEIIRAGIYK